MGLAHVNSDYAVIPLFPKIGSFFAFDSFWLFGVVLFVLNFRIWTLPLSKPRTTSSVPPKRGTSEVSHLRLSDPN